MNVEDRHYTNALSYTWPDLEAWVACNSNALQEEFTSEHKLGLTDLQRADRLRILQKFYHHFELDINAAKSWGDIVNLLQSALEFKCLNPFGNLRYNENIHFFEPCLDSSVGLSIKAHVLRSIGSITQMISYNLQRTILDTGYFYPEDAFVLSNESIKLIIQRTINDQSPLAKIETLLKFKSGLSKQNAWTYAVLDYSSLIIEERNLLNLYEWIDCEIMIQKSLLDTKSKAEVITKQSKDSFLFDYFYSYLRELVSKTINELPLYIQTPNPEISTLTDEQALESIRIIKKYYLRFKDYLKIYYSWNGVTDLIDETSKLAYNDGYNFIGPSTDIYINIAVDASTNNFLRQIREWLILNIDVESHRLQVSDAFMFLSNDAIINIIRDINTGRNSLQQIQYLTDFKIFLLENKSIQSLIDFSVPDKLFKKKRDVITLSQMIDEMILTQTPTIEFKSEGQIKLFAKIVARITTVVGNKKIEEYFEVLKAQKTIVKFDIKASKDFGDPIKSKASSADVIRYLLLVIEKFNPYYKIDRQSPMLWINYLFLDIPGYSLAHIQKAPQRKKPKVPIKSRP